jgi:hypothetical protein
MGYRDSIDEHSTPSAIVAVGGGHLAIVYMTGDSAGEWAARGIPNSILLTTPFAPAQLITAVSQLMNAGMRPAK